MSAADIQAAAFTDNNVAREAIEALLWPHGPVCPHCGCTGKIGKSKARPHVPASTTAATARSQFTVHVGTIFERSKVPLSKWWFAIHLMPRARRECSAHQLHRMLGVTPTDRLVHGTSHPRGHADGDLAPIGGTGSIVEVRRNFHWSQGGL